MDPKNLFARYMRNFIFGAEDSLVSTVGLLSGIFVTDIGTAHILITGMVYLFVEAFSMGVGSFLSEQTAEEYISGAETGTKRSVRGAIIMFFSYLLAGLIPLSPYILLPGEVAFPTSVIASIVALFALGCITARIFKISILKNSLRMAIIGGIAIGVGIAVGKISEIIGL